MAGKLFEGSADLPPESGIYTETLARLYLRQGFLDRAIDIYRHLVQEQPQNQQWQGQLHALTQQLQQGDVESESGLSLVAEEPSPHPQSQSTRLIIAQLERWLHYLQRQRLRR